MYLYRLFQNYKVNQNIKIPPKEIKKFLTILQSYKLGEGECAVCNSRMRIQVVRKLNGVHNYVGVANFLFPYKGAGGVR